MADLAHLVRMAALVVGTVATVCTASAGEPFDLLKQHGQTSGQADTGCTVMPKPGFLERPKRRLFWKNAVN
jgi:hypothetical protein